MTNQIHVDAFNERMRAPAVMNDPLTATPGTVEDAWDRSVGTAMAGSHLPGAQGEFAPLQGTQRNERQVLTVFGTGGTFTMTFSGQTTATVPFNGTAAQVQTALSNLSNIGAGNVAVTQPQVGGPYYIQFKGTLAKSNVAQITTTDTALTGTGAGAAVNTLTHGAA